MASLEDWADELENNPGRFFFKAFKWIFIVLFLIGTIGYFSGWFSDGAQTVKKEFSPSAMLKKYEWFKNASAQLDKKIADIDVWGTKIKSLEGQYTGKSRTEWLRSDAEQYNIWQSEINGIKSSYNSLAAEYNSAMSKFNYAFCNVGDLPEGAENPLPREYKPYISE
jgi:hypothetical protein